jgi:hypothetical protein
VFAAVDNINQNEPIAYSNIQNSTQYGTSPVAALVILAKDWKAIAGATEADPSISGPAATAAHYFRLTAWNESIGKVYLASHYWNKADGSANAYTVQAAVTASSLPTC